MTDLADLRVAVTGATGCIGRALVRLLLERGATVLAVGRPGATAPAPAGCVQAVAALTDPDAVAAAFALAPPDLVVHAGMPAGHPATAASRAELIHVGTMGMAAVLEASAAHGVQRLVNVGSSLETGPSAGPRREDETAPPVTFRGVVKAAQTLLCLQHAAAGLVPAVVVRPFTVYGPYEPPTRFIPTAVRAALEGHVLPLPATPSFRDFVHVDDVAAGIVAALVTPGIEGGVFNLGTGQATTLESVVAVIETASGRPVRREVGGYPTRPVDDAFGVADTTRARESLGWSASIGLEEGIASVVAWMRDRR